MARKHSRRRHLGGRLSLSSIRGQDLGSGAILGLLAGSAVEFAITAAQNRGIALPSFLTSGVGVISPPLVTGALVAAGVYAYTGPRRDRLGRTLGALAGGAAMAAITGVDAAVSTPAPSTAGWGFMPRTLPAGMGAPLFMNPRLQAYNGPIFTNPNTQLANYSFSRLAAAQGFGDENEDGNFPAP